MLRIDAPLAHVPNVTTWSLWLASPSRGSNTQPSMPSAYAGDIAGYRTFVAIVSVNYFTLLVLTPRGWGEPAPLWQLITLGSVYLALGIWGFEFAQRTARLPVALGYLLLEFGIGMTINGMAPGGLLPLILLPIAAQSVALLPRVWAALMCILVIAGVSGNLTWVPDWPAWFRNIASATAAVVFVVVYVGVAAREREARMRVEKLSAEVAHLAAANERNRLAREIHDTLGHYLTVIHVQLEAARAVMPAEPERGMLAISRAQALAKDGLTAVRQSVKALRDDSRVEGIAEQLASLVDAVRDESFSATFNATGSARPVTAAVALALHRTALEALTNVRKHAAATLVEIVLAFRPDGRVHLRVHDNGRGSSRLDGGFGLTGIRERAEMLGGSVAYHTATDEGFTLDMELPV